MICKNCDSEINSKYCSNCGQAAQLRRIDSDYIKHEIVHLLHIERGIFYTIKELLIRPGKSVRDFISEDRSRLVKPVIFIIITSLIYSLSASFFHFEDGYVGYSGDNTSVKWNIFQWVQEHYGYANIVMGFFIALWIKLFFRKKPFNIYEIIILLCFVIGMGMLILSVAGMIEGLFHLNVLQFGVIFLFLYIPWAIGQFYDRRRIISYIKALFAYVLGMLTFLLALVLVGSILDSILTHG